MLKQPAAILFGLAALLATMAPAMAEKRVALVIGNAAYEHAPRLINPSNDAADMAVKLRTLGFEVFDGVDLGKREMEKRIRAFADSLSGVDVALFYYAGHGLQVAGKNFLAPIDAVLKSESDLDFEAVELDLVLKQMVRKAPTSIIFLDACRDNPLAANLAQASRSLDIGRGLARVEAAASMMIVYATEPGKVALDGRGRNSPFTAALLRHIDAEGASISDVMIDVRNDVLRETNGNQRPFESASLTGRFFFRPAPAAAASEDSKTTSDIAALRGEIARLQADQGALLKSQQEQLARLQERLANEAKTEPQSSDAAPVRQDAAIGKAGDESAVPPSGERAAESPKTAAVEGQGSAAQGSAAPAAAPLPEDRSREEIVRDMLSELQRLDCHSGRIRGTWGAKAKLALERFNKVSALDLPLEEPQEASLDALKAWSGPNCPVEAATPPAKSRPASLAPNKTAPRGESPKKRASPAAAPRKPAARESAPGPKARAQTARPRPKPAPHSAGGGGEEQRELQRLFPSTAWPGKK